MLTSAVQLCLPCKSSAGKWGEFIMFLLKCENLESRLQREGLGWFCPHMPFWC